MANELPPPGISIIQQFRTVSPTIISPTLVSCIIGPAYQIVEAYETDATGSSVVNADAVVSVPPILTSQNAEDFAGLDGLTLIVAVNNGQAQTVTFSDPTAAGLTADQVKSQILSTSGISGWAAYTVTIGSSTYVQLRGNNAGDGQSLKVLAGTANTILGFDDYYEATGFSSYTQDKRYIAQDNFPDPRDNIDELDIVEDSIRVFINQGSALVEAKRDEAFLRNGSSAWILGTAISFPTSGLKSKILELTRAYGASEESLTFDGDAYAMDGTLVVPGSAYADPGTDTIEIQKNNDTAITVTFASPADIDAAVTAINAAWASTYSGEDVCFRADATGAADGSGTYIAFQVGGATATGDAVKVIEPTSGDAFSDIGFTSGQGAVASSLVYAINQGFNAPTAQPLAADGGSSKLKLSSYEGYLKVGDGTANTLLGLTDNAEQYALQGVDDGDGDTRSPIIRIPNADFSLDANAAQLVGDNDISGDNQVHRLTFQVALDGHPMQEIEFNGGPIVPSSAYSSPGTNTLGLIVNGTSHEITFASPADIDAAILAINTAVGQTVCYKSDSAGTYSASGTYIAFQVGGQTDAGGSIVIDYDAAYAAAFAAIGFSGTDDIYQTLTGAEIVTAINNTMGAGVASLSSNKLQLDSAELGDESKIEIGSGTANTILGFTAGEIDRGRPFKPVAGDAVYADGEFMGYIVQVTPGAVVTDLRLDREQAFATLVKKNWYIIALDIPSTLPSTRPTPNLVVDLAGDITIKHDIVRDTKGDPVGSLSDALMVTYKALRLDVTPAADNPALLTFEDSTELESLLEPVNTDNPLALGLYFALLNAPGVTVSGIGVDAISSSSPYGTLAGYNRALTFLESKEVYGLAPMTHEAVVHQAALTHADNMSAEDGRGERIVLFNPDMPGRAVDTLVVSGTDGDSTGVAGEFDTKLSNLASSLLAAGIDPTGTLTVDDGVYLDIASDSKVYSISSISGTKVILRSAFAPGENDDNYYTTDAISTTLVSETFTVKIRGAELVDANGDPDNSAIAETYADLAESYGNRRGFMFAPDKVNATVDGIEQLIEGFYVCAATSGMISQQPPQQGFSNFPITGFTGVQGSNDRFSNSQMNVAAAGGTYWIIQEVANGPLTSRMQISTDTSTIEKRELSITKIVDYCAKFMRAGLRNFIGKFNITQGFLDTLGTVIQGMISFLSEAGVIIGGDLNNIIQDSDNPDTVLIDVTLDPPYPCNYLRLTLVV